MVKLKNNSRPVSVKALIARSWLALALTGFFVCIAILVVLALKDSRENRNATIAYVESVQTKLARRLAAEILLPNRGSEPALIQQLRQEFGFVDVRSTTRSVCDSNSNCVVDNGKVSTAQFSNPFLDDTEFLQIDFAYQPLESFFEPREFLISLMPILAIFLVGVTLQMRILRARIADPISQLQRFSERTGSPPTDWPLEIQNIALQLQDSFKRRDAEILAQISRGIIHDIRNYLHSVSIATDLAKSSFQLPQPKAEALVANLIATSDSNLKRVTALIDRTLDASNDIELNLQTFSLNRLIEECIESFLPLFRKSEVEIRMPDRETDFHYHGDRIQLARVLSNLLQNAVDSISQSNSKDRVIAVRCLEGSTDLVVEVEDSGPGVPDSLDLSFSRIKSSKKHGSGLGLFIAHRIVEQHGGKLQAQQSTKLGGARFSISLPLKSNRTSEALHV